MSTAINQIYDTILILDFGSQYSHLITRRVRELGVYCELQACTYKIDDLNFKPKGIILSGGPYSVYDDVSPHMDKKVWELGVPVLGICYGLQEIAWDLGGEVAPCESREYGHADIKIVAENRLFKGLGEDMKVWMSHGDQLKKIPEGFRVIAKTGTAPFAGIDNEEKNIYGIQFHPEVTHTPRGKELLKNFVIDICGAQANWSMSSFIDREISRIRNLVGPTAQVIGAVSGGVDSTVASKIMTLAIGDRYHAVLVDNGVMRLNECETVKEVLNEKLNINLTVTPTADLFLSKLKGVTDPEKKEKDYW